jgi:23S rRNA pseudouridine2605 synthase
MSPERIQKLLARAGYGSRREIERWIEQGLVILNGTKARLGDKASTEDKIELRGKLLSLGRVADFRPRILAYHKPEGELVSRQDMRGRTTVFERLPSMQSSRWVSVGRLDLNSAGLLLFTNDGELANRLMHPSSEIEREYAVRVFGAISAETLKKLQAGVVLEDGKAGFDRIVDAGGSGANHWYHVVLKEGRKREVRRLWESQGMRVSRLIRIRYGSMVLERSLRPGKWKELGFREARDLYQAAGMKPPSRDELYQSRRSLSPWRKN